MKLNGIYHMATFGVGFYIGYNEGMGIDVNDNIENTLKYGPTIFSTTGSILVNKLLISTNKLMKKTLNEESLNTIQKEKLNSAINKLEKTIEKHPYIESVVSGGKTALITFLGYATGKFASQIN